ncbi:hypothetical protein FA13DRAFT_1715078 [Coprinellus micaceus]|uniref:Uncharacterized protein n=1 Tax=Coprinellus micaceus TaxID=71717 RepID=A0A4Y7SQD8_COPMI|nr:hypothetical protein FA13DRAFT_1715078 [Coprinellus micaceus]
MPLRTYGSSPLALTNKEFNQHAEEIMYESVSIHTRRSPLGALEAAACSPTRAAKVKSFALEFSYRPRETDTTATNVMTLLFLALPSMACLQDLRICLRRDLQHYASDLNDVLWYASFPVDRHEVNVAVFSAGHFKLLSVYVDDFLDLPRIANSHPALEVFGTFADKHHHGPISLLSSAVINHSLLFVGLERRGDSWWSNYTNLYLAPELLHPDHLGEIGELIRKSFEKGSMSEIKMAVNRVDELYLVLREPLPEGQFFTLTQSLAKTFPRMDEVSICMRSCAGMINSGLMNPAPWKSITSVAIISWKTKMISQFERDYCGGDYFGRGVQGIRLDIEKNVTFIRSGGVIYASIIQLGSRPAVHAEDDSRPSRESRFVICQRRLEQTGRVESHDIPGNFWAGIHE